MTSQEVRALIDAKIKGQGTNVDAGSVLPAILNGILDLIDAGGGGGTSDAVQYIPQELTSPQQMQARKNQGLYYSEGGGEDVTLNWDGDTTGKESIMGSHFKVSAEAPQPSDLKTISTFVDGNTITVEVGSQNAPIVPAGVDGVYFIGEGLCVVCTVAEAMIGPTAITQGIWFARSGNDLYTSQLVYTSSETIHHIEPKYIKDMYYEEEGVKTIYYDIHGDRAGSYTKVSDEVIEASAVIGHKFTSYSKDSETEYTITEDMVIAADGTQPTGILYPSEPNWAILIFPEDMEFEGDSFSKGVWFRDEGTIVNPNHIESLEYEGVTVHQIPEKYIPSVGTPVVKIEIPSIEVVSYGIGHVILNNYESNRDVVFSIEGTTIEQVAVRNMLDTTSTGDVWDFATGNTYNFDTSGYYLVEITTGSGLYYATVFVETINM